ncbi:hypothetical protein AB3N04_13345 [Alkalihalophilus sp. As8PL]|uniref:DUF4878 domain-containing protein n=1 Tax=Alkalihalophilus sp. As8PL TaxID=3237103 RepID=A0AB39BQA1_9BACI
MKLNSIKLRRMLYVGVALLFLVGFFFSSDISEGELVKESAVDNTVSSLMLYHQATVFKLQSFISDSKRDLGKLEELLNNQVSPHLIERIQRENSITTNISQLEREIETLQRFGESETPSIAFQSNQVITLQTKAPKMNSVTYKKEGQYWTLHSYSIDN